MLTSNKHPRLNYNVPRSIVNDIKRIASQRGMEPSWWIRKVLERAIEEEAKHPIPVIDLSKFESFNDE